jgi:peptidoglycan/LPS O-acetylase OafA/YrhL
MTVASLNSKNNSIGFLRFVLACLVVFSHCYPLGGFKLEPLVAWSDGHQTLGGFGVAGFFFLSGYLILQRDIDLRLQSHGKRRTLKCLNTRRPNDFSRRSLPCD